MVVVGPVGGCISIAVLASAYVCGSRRHHHRTTLQGTGASQMNATDVMLAEPGTAQSESMADENVPAAPPVPSFDYARVVEALAGTPYMLTIAAQLAAMLRARIGSGGLAPNQPIPGESTLMRQYGVARETARKAVRVLVAEGLVYVVQGRGAYVAARG
jgi:GntR family transcriptional regulator